MQREPCPVYKGLDNARMKELHVPGAHQGQWVCEGNLSLIQHLHSVSYTTPDWKPYAQGSLPCHAERNNQMHTHTHTKHPSYPSHPEVWIILREIKTSFWPAFSRSAMAISSTLHPTGSGHSWKYFIWNNTSELRESFTFVRPDRRMKGYKSPSRMKSMGEFNLSHPAKKWPPDMYLQDQWLLALLRKVPSPSGFC